MNNSDEPLVSIIVPTYNVEKYCSQCFDSIINQTLTNIEIILVDDGSTDNSGKICDEYAEMDKRIKVIHQNNVGLGLSRNSGMRIARGKYIGFVDSDDFISKKMYETLYFNAIKYDADISYCGVNEYTTDSLIQDDNFVNSNLDKSLVYSSNDIKQYLLDRIGCAPNSPKDNNYGASVCCGIFRKRLLDKYNIEFVSERQFIAEDIIFDIDIIPHCCLIVHSPEKLYYYRHNPNSLTTTYRKDRFEKNKQLYFEMGRRLSARYHLEQIKYPLYRYFLTFTRVILIQISLSKAIKFSDKIRSIKHILNDNELRMILKEYPIKKLPSKYRVMCGLEQNKCALSILLLIKIFYLK